MIIINDISKMQEFAKNEKSKGRTIAFVPTMGALHEGHVSLLRKARRKGDTLVLSIFVNPIQFDDPKDLKKYPKPLKKDMIIAQQQKVDVLFCPTVKQMYPDGFSTYVVEENLSKGLCAHSRPGHFQGVTTVVAKLFNMIQPDISFFGQKDYQQARIIQKMVYDLGWSISIEIVSTVREQDGLACSSRNKLLSKKERVEALCLNEALFMAKVIVAGGEKKPNKIVQRMKRIIENKSSAKIDYIEIVDPYTLEKIKTLKGEVLIALAVYIGKVRLIDNLIIHI